MPMTLSRAALTGALLCISLAWPLAGPAGAGGLPLSIEPVNTDALPDIGEEWLTENPYRSADPVVWEKAIDIGESGFIQNCARCHGLGAISGGLAPDIRFLEAEEGGDEWYVERFRSGAKQDGVTKMPAFGDLLGQKAAWAIRTYVETRPDQDTQDPFGDRLKEIRDMLKIAEAGLDVEPLKAELGQIATEIATASGAPVADSIARRAAGQLSDDPATYVLAAETLTVGLSAAN
jgi:cytochrome c-550 PedF